MAHSPLPVFHSTPSPPSRPPLPPSVLGAPPTPPRCLQRSSASTMWCLSPPSNRTGDVLVEARPPSPRRRPAPRICLRRCTPRAPAPLCPPRPSARCGRAGYRRERLSRRRSRLAARPRQLAECTTENSKLRLELEEARDLLDAECASSRVHAHLRPCPLDAFALALGPLSLGQEALCGARGQETPPRCRFQVPQRALATWRNDAPSLLCHTSSCAVTLCCVTRAVARVTVSQQLRCAVTLSHERCAVTLSHEQLHGPRRWCGCCWTPTRRCAPIPLCHACPPAPPTCALALWALACAHLRILFQQRAAARLAPRRLARWSSARARLSAPCARRAPLRTRPCARAAP